MSQHMHNLSDDELQRVVNAGSSGDGKFTKYETEAGTWERAVVEELAKRAGHRAETAPSSNPHATKVAGLSLREVAREICFRANVTAAVDDVALYARAFSTSDGAAITKDIGNKELSRAYKHSPGTFQAWMAPSTSPNFKPLNVVRFTPPPTLPEVIESGEYTYLAVSDGYEIARVKTYGGMLSFSRHAMINDDLGALAGGARAVGMTAKNTQNRLSYQALLANPQLSDGLNVFHGDRCNLLSGAESALSRTSLSTAVKTMRMMTDAAGSPLSIEPKFLLVPPSLEITAFELCYSDSVPGQANSAVPNLFKKLGLVPIVEPLLESPALSGSSATAWYLMPDPNLWPVFTYVTLDSSGDSLAPYVESAPVFMTDGLQYKCRIDFGVAALDSKAVKSLGQ